MRESTIAITANFTAEPLAEPLSFLMAELGFAPRIEFAPYNQIFQQLLDPASLCSRNQAGINIVLIRFEDWTGVQSSDDGNIVIPPDASENLKRTLEGLSSAVKSAALSSAIPYVLVVCPSSLAARAQSKFSDCLNEMEAFLADQLEGIKGVSLILSEPLASVYPVDKYDDPEGCRLGHIPYTEVFFSALAAMISRRVFRLWTAPHKVIALDCDQTLWQGVCGEDGPLGIAIDEARRNLQEFMIGQHKAGMLLCLCSKNNEEDVWEVF